jgi:hypothetical protein
MGWNNRSSPAVWTFGLAEIVRHGHKIHHTGHKFALKKIWDKY